MALRGLLTITSPVRSRNRLAPPAPPVPAEPSIANGFAASSPSPSSCPSHGACGRREEVGEGGSSATAFETESSNSSCVMFDKADESIVSINWIAPARDER